jgi:hypothetical protein
LVDDGLAARGLGPVRVLGIVVVVTVTRAAASVVAVVVVIAVH